MALPKYVAQAFLQELVTATGSKKYSTEYLGAFVTGPCFLGVTEALAGIDSVHAEMIEVLGDLETLGSHSSQSTILERLALEVKFYTVSWSTLGDMLAGAISAAFDLGTHQKDISLGSVLRNTHVAASEVPTIFTRYDATLDAHTMRRMRNDIVHRGILPDDEVESLRSRYATVIYEQSRATVESHELVSRDSFQDSLTEIQEAAQTLAQARHTDYLAHYEETVRLIDDLIRALARVTAIHVERDAP